MARKAKEIKGRFLMQDRAGNSIDVFSLPEEECREVRIWSYQNMVRGLGYRPAQGIEPESNPVRDEVYKWAENYQKMMSAQKTAPIDFGEHRC